MLLNNILGPGIANFPGMFQKAGWLAPSLFVLVCATSSLVGGEMLVASMRSMPGNDRFQKRVEYSTLCRHFFAPHWAVVCNILFQLAMLTANISNIIQTSQVFDQTIDSLFGDSCALEFYPAPRFFCGSDQSDISPFGTGKALLSVGACIVAVLSLPLGYWNLDDNIAVQNVAMVLIIVSMVVWMLIFLALGLDFNRVPAIRSEDGVAAFHGLGGTILFNFMFISTLPSWVCEKRPDVTAMRVLFMTLALAAVMFLGVGIGGGLAFPEYYDGDNTLLSELHHIELSGWKAFANISVDVYAVAANLASIPIFSIMMRYNLLEQKLVGPRTAGFVSIVVPWLASVLLFCGTGFQQVVQFSGTFTSAIVNLIVPGLLFIASQGPRAHESACEALSPPRDSLAELSPGSGRSGSSLSADCSPSRLVREDRSGHIGSPRAARWWLRIAWGNTALMSVVTVVAIADQLLNAS